MAVDISRKVFLNALGHGKGVAGLKRLLGMLGAGQTLRYAGREASSSTATGSHTIHQMEQRDIVRKAFGVEGA